MNVPEFWSLVDKTGDCWVWLGPRKRKGYGIAKMHPSLGIKTVLAHRVAFLLSGDAIPDGQTLDHLCRNTSCVRPSHMEPVTRSENTIRQLNAMYGWAECMACGEQIPGQYTFCPPCWRLISDEKKAAIVAEFTPGVAPSRQMSGAYRDAVEAATKA